MHNGISSTPFIGIKVTAIAPYCLLSSPLPSPPLCQVTMSDCCGNVSIFQKLGSLGISSFNKNRICVMMVSIVLTSFSWVLTIVAMAGSSVDNETVKNCAWTHQESSGYDIYYGTIRMVLDPTSVDVPNTNYEDCASDLCNDCEHAGKTATNCSVMTFVLLFFFVGLSVVRVKSDWDNVTMKATFVLMSSVNMLIMIIGMGSWDDQCIDPHITHGGKF